MAIEAVKTAAMTYQGSVSNAAAPVKSTVPSRPVKSDRPASQADTSKTVSTAETPEVSEKDPVKPIQAVSGDGEEKGGGFGGSGQQTTKQLQEAVEKLKKKMMTGTEAVFGIHEGTNRMTIKIVEKDTKDVIKEYPPEQTLDMIQKVWEMAGIMVDERG